MFLITLVVAFFVCAYGAVLPSIPRLDGRIVGGALATISEAPYQVSALYQSSHTCGGSIISTYTILTAAHCLDGTSASSWSVRAGSTFWSSGGQLIAASRLLSHSSFTAYLDYDIALIILQSQLTLGTNVALITLPSQGQTIADGTSTFVTGWGATYEGGPVTTQLRKVNLPIVNQETCINAYSSYNPVTSRMLCAGRYGVGGQDACQGDSGGPLTYGGVLFGITSWGYGCARPEYPGVWTRVSYFRAWINNNIQ